MPELTYAHYGAFLNIFLKIIVGTLDFHIPLLYICISIKTKWL